MHSWSDSNNGPKDGAAAHPLPLTLTLTLTFTFTPDSSTTGGMGEHGIHSHPFPRLTPTPIYLTHHPRLRPIRNQAQPDLQPPLEPPITQLTYKQTTGVL